MKTLALIAMLTTQAVTPPPLVPMSDAPIEQAVPAYARWWVWALFGTGTLFTAVAIAGIALFSYRVPQPGAAR